MHVVGLTGGIAAGKSTVSEALRALGAAVIDADRVGHEAYAPGTATHEAVVEAFGERVLAPDGTIDRRALGAIVFADPAQRERLQGIVWPRLRAILQERLAALAAQGTAVAVIEAAVLLEAGWEDLVDEVWTVQAPEETVMRRLMERNGLTADEARARIRAQLSNEERARRARVVIDNGGSVAEAQARVREAYSALAGLSRP